MASGSMMIADAQQDMRAGYFDGAPGMITSAAAWLVASVIAYRGAPRDAVWALFIGGALIHPVSVMLTKLLGRSGKHLAGNPLAALAMATTVWMILCLPLAYNVSLIHLEWFFPAMLFVIGGRYMTFATLFGRRVFWICGAALAAAGYGLGHFRADPALAAFTGTGIEGAFAVAIFVLARREGMTKTRVP